MKSSTRILLVVLILFFVGAEGWAQPALPAEPSPVGRWVTIDDERNEPRSVVQIYEAGDQLFAKVDSIYLREGEPSDPLCIECKGERKDQPIVGMTIMWAMERRGDTWSGGRILDPEKGKVYRCKIWIEGGTLKVRGYLGPFYRTQTWLPVEL